MPHEEHTAQGKSVTVPGTQIWWCLVAAVDTFKVVHGMHQVQVQVGAWCMVQVNSNSNLQ